MSDVVYLYGFVPDHVQVPDTLLGIADAPVEIIDAGPARAVVSHLPPGYTAADVEARLQDLAWVGEQGVAHERVVTWLADNADILPARLFSLYTNDAALRDSARVNGALIAHALRTIATRREWNLKVAYDAEKLAEHGAELSELVRAADAEIAEAPPGRRYLLRKKRAELVKQEVSRMARTAADDMLHALAAHAEDSRVLPIAAADRSGTVVLNAAFLVARDAEPALRAEAERLYDRYTALGLIVSFSGPWAPYRFLEPHGEA